MPAQTIIDVLVKEGLLNSQQAEAVRFEHLTTDTSVFEIIKRKRFLSEDQLFQLEAKLKKIPIVNLDEKAAVPQALDLVPRSVAERFVIIPFGYNRTTNELSLAMADPLDLAAIDFLAKKTGAIIKPFIAPMAKIQAAISVNYSQNLSAEVKAVLKDTLPTDALAKGVAIDGLDGIIREAPVAKIVSTILEFAVRARASDVHIEAQEDKTRVRYRIDGILHEKLILPRSIHDALVSRIKILAGMKIDEKRVPQDGRFNFKTNDAEVDLRVSSLPTVHGEKIVMRLLKKSGGVPDLPDLGLRGRALKDLQDSILRPHGIILVCGPTGSGKTTTLYSALMRINTPKLNIMTLEDPVEYQMAGVNQVQINPVAGLTFASGLRSFLRQDPNIIMVGEIRDKETAELAVQAALTGHLVFSTVHTNNASQAIPRMIDLGVEPFLLASSLTCLLAQRICRRVCPECQEKFTPLPEVAEDVCRVLGKLLPDKKEIKLTRGKKCAACNNTGYLARIGIYEVLPVTEKLSRLLLERAAALDIEKQALLEGMITMKQDGYLKALDGLTTIEEVLRVAEE
ncbi:MAG: ATPase, T2SS/T4P/T4SS family [Candidatus Shapirobacteria bacterium]